MKKQHLKNLSLNKKSISKLSALGLAGGEGDYDHVNTVIICNLKSKPYNEINICFKTLNNHCWQTEVIGCGVPNTYQVNTDTVALC